MPDLTELANWATIVAVPLAIVTTGITIWLFFRGREKRALACEFDPVVSPIEIKAGDALGGDIEIRYEGQPVENLFVVRAKIKNTGNTPIRKSEVVEPIAFDFGDDAELVRRPEVVERRPENLRADWLLEESVEKISDKGTPSSEIVRENRVFLVFDLLNPKEELTTEFVCTGKAATPGVTARIEGVGSIETLKSGEQPSPWVQVVVDSVVLAAGVSTSLVYVSDQSTFTKAVLLSVLLATVLLVMFLLPGYLPGKRLA